MTTAFRKLALTAHITSSVGWLGAVLAYLPLAITGLTSHDAQTVRASYISMELIGWFVIVPCCLAALLSGLVQSFATEWGLFRHYWITLKFVLTTFATIILLLHMPAVSRMARAAAEMTLPILSSEVLRTQLVIHAGGGLFVLVTTTALSVHKPFGLTPYGRRRLSQPTAGAIQCIPSRTSWKLYVLLGIIAVAILLAVRHLVSGGLGMHAR